MSLPPPRQIQWNMNRILETPSDILNIHRKEWRKGKGRKRKKEMTGKQRRCRCTAEALAEVGGEQSSLVNSAKRRSRKKLKRNGR